MATSRHIRPIREPDVDKNKDIKRESGLVDRYLVFLRVKQEIVYHQKVRTIS